MSPFVLELAAHERTLPQAQQQLAARLASLGGVEPRPSLRLQPRAAAGRLQEALEGGRSSCCAVVLGSPRDEVARSCERRALVRVASSRTGRTQVHPGLVLSSGLPE